MDKVLFSHNSNKWNTPDFIYSSFIARGYYDPFPRNWDGLDYKDFIHFLIKNGERPLRLFINPPFELLSNVVDFITDHLFAFNKVVILMPVRTDTKYFNKLVNNDFTFYFIKGRLHFNNSISSAPFPTMFCIYTKYKNYGYDCNRFKYIEDINKFFNDYSQELMEVLY